MRYENDTDGSQVWKEIMQNMVQETEDNILTTENEVRDLFYLFADDLDEEWTVAKLEYSAHPLNGKGADVCITTRIER